MFFPKIFQRQYNLIVRPFQLKNKKTMLRNNEVALLKLNKIYLG